MGPLVISTRLFDPVLELLHELARGNTLGPLRWLLSSCHLW